MNRIVKHHYPVAQLPDDLREGLDPTADVVVTVEEIETSGQTATIEEIFAARQPPFRTATEIDRMIRRQRDDWDA